MRTDESPGRDPASAVVLQLERHTGLSGRLAMPWDRIVVLERIARGGGNTRWYLAKDQHDVRRAFALLNPGSRVTFYFAGPLHVEPVSDTVIGEMFAAVGVTDEIVIAAPDSDPLALDAEFVWGPSELTEYLMQPHSSGDVMWGPFPGVDEPDAITVRLVDADGILRRHPH